MSPIDHSDLAKRFLQFVERLVPIVSCGLVFVALLLALLHHSYWQYGIDKNNIPASFFDLDSESTIGSWFASIQWFLISLGAFIAYYLEGLFKVGRRQRIWWLVVGLVFLVASLDEAAIVHETMGELIKPLFADRGIGGSIWSYFRESPWLVFYVLPLGGFILYTLWFLSDRLGSRKEAILCSLGFAFFVVALIIEFVQGLPNARLLPIAQMFGSTCASFYSGSVLVEETMENIGSTMVLAAFSFYNYHLLLEGLLNRQGESALDELEAVGDINNSGTV